MAYATADDVANRLGRPLSPDEVTFVETLLGDAEIKILSRVPMLHEYVATGKISRDAVVLVEANAVLRVVRNPEGFRSEQEGDYLYARDVATASGLLNILPDEWALLKVNKAFTIYPDTGRKNYDPRNFPPHAWQWSWPAEGWREYYDEFTRPW